MNVKSLRDEGVTLHLLLVGQSERDPVPDVPAIYFCRPTEENLRRIAKVVNGRVRVPIQLAKKPHEKPLEKPLEISYTGRSKKMGSLYMSQNQIWISSGFSSGFLAY